MALSYETYKLKALFELNNQEKLLLPNFQREFIWKPDSSQLKLLSSVLVGLPIGSLLILEGNYNDFAARDLCMVDSFPSKKGKGESYFLLDGQQRISTLKSIFFDFYNLKDWQKNWTKIYSYLRNRWFLRVKPDDGEADIWAWQHLNFNKINLKKLEPSEIEDFIIFYKIFKTKDTDKNYHPEYYQYQLTKEDEDTLRERIARQFAEKWIVPLWELNSSKGEKALHVITLKYIARNRRNELRSLVGSGKIKIDKILGIVEPKISEIKEKSVINDAWSDLATKWQNRVRESIEAMLDYELTAIQLDKTELHRATAIFESINIGGTPLDLFDLIVAKYARSGSSKSLREIILEHLQKEMALPKDLYPISEEKEFKWNGEYINAIENTSISKIIKDQFLIFLSIFSYERELKKGIEGIQVDHIKKSKIIGLTLNQIKNNVQTTKEAIKRALAFLQVRCGIINIGDLNYKLMILPIGYIVKEDSNWKDKKALDKLEYWFWSSLFSGSYREKQNERVIEDIKKIKKWIEGSSKNPFKSRYDKIFDHPGYSDLELLLMKNEDQEIPAAISNGIIQYVLSCIPNDFTKEKKKLKPWEIGKNKYKIEIHHIIPLGSITQIGQTAKELRKNKDHILNSPLNKTPISYEANQNIKSLSPEKYLKHLEEITLYGHFIPTPIETKFENFDRKEKQEQLLKERFEEIKKEIKKELDRFGV
ncbi:MAG: DUF262 domain-containing protein [Ignavibacteria bacterium]|nr:MAG: DUF262 domain-containing protein [Ignavibacteria bacterium]